MVGQHHVYYEGDGQAKRSEADGKSADLVEGQMLGIIRSIRSDPQTTQARNHIRLQITPLTVASSGQTTRSESS